MDEQPATGTDLGLGRLVNLDGSPRKVARLEHIVTAVMASGFVSVDDLAEDVLASDAGAEEYAQRAFPEEPER